MDSQHEPSRAPAGEDWAIVLAGGQGTRLSVLTRDDAGDTVPKQFCSFDGSASLIEQAVARAANVVSPERVMAVVAPEHRRHWEPTLRNVAPGNIVVQPLDRGTAVGILLPVLRIATRDPGAQIVIMPSDHYVADEALLASIMRGALHDVCEHSTGVTLLGIQASEPDPELGYVLSRPASHPRLRKIQLFVEKPTVDEARRLMSDGAVWNSFIIVCRASALIELLRKGYPDVVEALQAVKPEDEATLKRVYEAIPTIDFSRHVATGQEHRLTLTIVPACGWNDLGTPRRLAQTVARQRTRCTGKPAAEPGAHSSWINLTERLAQIQPALGPET